LTHTGHAYHFALHAQKINRCDVTNVVRTLWKYDWIQAGKSQDGKTTLEDSCWTSHLLQVGLLSVETNTA